jgi:hypothetical protein
VNAAGDRMLAARGTPAHVHQLSQLVEKRVRETSESYSVALANVANENPDVAHAARRALSIPLINGIALTDR